MFILKRRNLIITLVLVITFLTFIFSITALVNSSVTKADASGIKIVLDAGHGGVDAGVSGVATGVKESELNLAIVKKVERYFLDAGFSVTLTRKTSAGLYGVATKNRKKKDMEARKAIIEKENPTLLISVHMNNYSLKSRRGAQVFYTSNEEKSKVLANCIQTSFNDMEECVKKTNPILGDYYILNCTNTPGVIAECGFLSNDEDEALLITEEYQQKIAYAIFKGAINYLSLTS